MGDFFSESKNKKLTFRFACARRALFPFAWLRTKFRKKKTNKKQNRFKIKEKNRRIHSLAFFVSRFLNVGIAPVDNTIKDI